MSLLFDKILPLGVYPLGIALILIASGIALNFVGRRRASILLLSFAVVELWAFSTPLVSRLLLTTLENTNSPILTKSADVAILLGGMIRGGHDAPDLTDAADRAVTAFRLFRKGQVKSILVSGGNLPWSSDAVPEAQHIAGLLREWGIPGSVIIIEDRSRNTWENAVNSKSLWDKHGFRSGFLVTSASHMPRSLAAFRRVGLTLAPAATDFRAQPYLEGGVLAVLPSAEALQDSTSAIKEWLGRVVYQMRGWG